MSYTRTRSLFLKASFATVLAVAAFSFTQTASAAGVLEVYKVDANHNVVANNYATTSIYFYGEDYAQPGGGENSERVLMNNSQVNSLRATTTYAVAENNGVVITRATILIPGTLPADTAFTLGVCYYPVNGTPCSLSTIDYSLGFNTPSYWSSNYSATIKLKEGYVARVGLKFTPYQNVGATYQSVGALKVKIYRTGSIPSNSGTICPGYYFNPGYYASSDCGGSPDETQTTTAGMRAVYLNNPNVGAGDFNTLLQQTIYKIQYVWCVYSGTTECNPEASMAYVDAYVAGSNGYTGNPNNATYGVAYFEPGKTTVVKFKYTPLPSALGDIRVEMVGSDGTRSTLPSGAYYEMAGNVVPQYFQDNTFTIPAVVDRHGTPTMYAPSIVGSDVSATSESYGICYYLKGGTPCTPTSYTPTTNYYINGPYGQNSRTQAVVGNVPVRAGYVARVIIKYDIGGQSDLTVYKFGNDGTLNSLPKEYDGNTGTYITPGSSIYSFASGDFTSEYHSQYRQNPAIYQDIGPNNSYTATTTRIRFKAAPNYAAVVGTCMYLRNTTECTNVTYNITATYENGWFYATIPLEAGKGTRVNIKYTSGGGEVSVVGYGASETTATSPLTYITLDPADAEMAMYNGENPVGIASFSNVATGQKTLYFHPGWIIWEDPSQVPLVASAKYCITATSSDCTPTINATVSVYDYYGSQIPSVTFPVEAGKETKINVYFDRDGSGFGNSSVMYKIVGGDLTTGTAPSSGAANIDNAASSYDQYYGWGAPPANPRLITNVTPGQHFTYIVDLPGYAEKYGTCTYDIGAAQCSVTTFTSPLTIDPSKNNNWKATTTTISGKVTKVAVQYISSTQTGDLLIKRVGADDTIYTAPYSTVNIDGGSDMSAANPFRANDQPEGARQIKFSNYANTNEKIGTCQYSRGSAECTVTSFTQNPTCIPASCSYIASVKPGFVTKVAIKYFPNSVQAETQSGNILIKRVGPDETIDSLPAIPASGLVYGWSAKQYSVANTIESPIGSGVDTVFTNPAVGTGIPGGSYIAWTKNISSFVETAGTCTYPIGDPECTVTTFNIQAECSTNANNFCYVPVSVTNGYVTKVVFKYALGVENVTWTSNGNVRVTIYESNGSTLSTGKAVGIGDGHIQTVGNNIQSAFSVYENTTQNPAMFMQVDNPTADTNEGTPSVKSGYNRIHVINNLQSDPQIGLLIATCTHTIGSPACTVNANDYTTMTNSGTEFQSPIRIEDGKTTQVYMKYLSQSTGDLKTQRVYDTGQIIPMANCGWYCSSPIDTTQTYMGEGYDFWYPPGDNPHVFAGLNTGTQSFFVTNVDNYLEIGGTCTYPRNGTECEVTVFDRVLSCNRTENVYEGPINLCVFPVNLTANSVTKAAVMYINYDYQLTAQYPSITAPQGSTTINKITATLTYGTAHTVNLSAIAPEGVTPTFSDPVCDLYPCTRTLSLAIAQNMATGSYPITVQGLPIGRTTDFILTVDAGEGQLTPASTLSCRVTPTNPRLVNNLVTLRWYASMSGDPANYTFTWKDDNNVTVGSTNITNAKEGYLDVPYTTGGVKTLKVYVSGDKTFTDPCTRQVNVTGRPSFIEI